MKSAIIAILVIMLPVGNAFSEIRPAGGPKKNTPCVFFVGSPFQHAKDSASGGFFTKTFLEGLLSKKESNVGGKMTASEISAYMTWQAIAKESNQTPVVDCRQDIVFYEVVNGKVSWALGKTRLVGVGIDDYQKMPDLAGCLKDLSKIEQTFRALGGEEVSIVSLRNQDATRENILRSLYEAVRSDVETIIFYYSGYSSRNMLMPVETIHSEPYLSGILMQTLRDILNEAHDKRVVVISDSDFVWSSHRFRTR